MVFHKSQFKSGLRVLVVEDDPFNQMYMKVLLNCWNIQPDISENGQGAIAHVREKDYDLILMDIEMPVMDGIAATRYIRDELNRSTPVIAVTAGTQISDPIIAGENGMDGFISKPFEPPALYNVLKRYFVSEDETDTDLNADTEI